MSGRFLLVVGESLVDLIEEGGESERAYRPRYGGSPLNVAVGAARLGTEVRFVTAVGSDAFGRQISSFLNDENVTVVNEPSDERRTCLAVATRVDGNVAYEYFGDLSSMVDIQTIPPHLVDKAAVVHAGSTALLSDPALGAVTTAFERTKAFKTLDPNPRPALMEDAEAYLAGLDRIIDQANLVKLSAEDIETLYPAMTPQAAAEALIRRGVQAVIVTAASEPALVATRTRTDWVSVSPIDAVDPTGAGDSFMASLLADICRQGAPSDHAMWVRYAARAADAAAVTCASVGGASSMPHTTDLTHLPPLASPMSPSVAGAHDLS